MDRSHLERNQKEHQGKEGERGGQMVGTQRERDLVSLHPIQRVRRNHSLINCVAKIHSFLWVISVRAPGFLGSLDYSHQRYHLIISKPISTYLVNW